MDKYNFIKRKKNIFYGWIIVGAAFILMSVGMGIISNTASIFIDPLSQDLNLSIKAINFTFTLRGFVQLSVSLLSVIIFKKFKIINLMRISSITLGISIFCHSFIESVSTLYILTLISSTSAMFMTILPLSIILNNWFITNKGSALGIAFMGSGAGGMIFSFIAGNLIANYGWRFAYQFLGIITLLLTTPITFFIIKMYPRDLGLKPYGSLEENRVEEDSLDIPEENELDLDGLSLQEALGTFRFWAIALSITTFAMAGVTMMVNMAPHLINIGYSTTTSSNVVALSMGSLAISKVVLGYFFDKFGMRISTTIACTSTLIALFTILNFNSNLALLIIIIFSGLGNSFITVSIPVITAKVFGGKDYSSIYGVLVAFVYIGNIISPVIVGFLFDKFNSYLPAFKFMLILSIITLINYQFVYPKTQELYD